MEHIRNYLSILQFTMSQLPLQRIMEVIDVLQQARQRGSQVFVMGNGGSASTASHFVCDLAKNTRRAGSPDFRVIGLSDNMAMLSAYANDEGYENVFSQQLVSLIRPGDVVIAISASGNSRNVINAMEEARKHNVTLIGFTGFDGGRLGQIVNIHLHVNSALIEHVEDVHLILQHIIVKSIKEQLPSEANMATSISQLPVEIFGD